MAAQIGAILLAAGASRRMGAQNKLLLPVDGVPMVVRVAGAIAGAGLPMLVVLGCEATAVRAAFYPRRGGGREQITFLHASNWVQGMGASLAAGVCAVPPHWTGALVCLGDMPFVSADLLRRLAAALTSPGAVAVPVHAGRRGNPVGWGRAWFPRLAVLGGDAGGRALLVDADPIELAADASIHRDFDTPEDFAIR